MRQDDDTKIKDDFGRRIGLLSFQREGDGGGDGGLSARVEDWFAGNTR